MQWIRVLEIDKTLEFLVFFLWNWRWTAAKTNNRWKCSKIKIYTFYSVNRENVYNQQFKWILIKTWKEYPFIVVETFEWVRFWTGLMVFRWPLNNVLYVMFCGCSICRLNFCCHSQNTIAFLMDTTFHTKWPIKCLEIIENLYRSSLF